MKLIACVLVIRLWRNMTVKIDYFTYVYNTVSFFLSKSIDFSNFSGNRSTPSTFVAAAEIELKQPIFNNDWRIFQFVL